MPNLTQADTTAAARTTVVHPPDPTLRSALHLALHRRKLRDESVSQATIPTAGSYSGLLVRASTNYMTPGGYLWPLDIGDYRSERTTASRLAVPNLPLVTL